MIGPDPRLVAAPWRTAPASVTLLDALEADGCPARFVGGCVRDALAARPRPVLDVDLCTPEPPVRVLDLLDRAAIRAIPSGLDHGTVTAIVDGRSFEVTTLRIDVATDGRHATVAFTDDFDADAARRDFTFNAMSCDRVGALFDPFQGDADLAAGRVRFVGDAATRIAEDRLRVLRYFRFFAGFGEALPDDSTRAALVAGAQALGALSGERIWQELRKLLETPDPRAAVALMADFGVLEAVLGIDVGRGTFDGLVPLETEPDAIRRLASLLRDRPDATGSLASCLRLGRTDAERLERLVHVPAVSPAELTAAELRRLLYRHGADGVLTAGLFAIAPTGSIDASDWHARVARTPVPAFPLRGQDALDRGVPPGPTVGALLAEVERWWLDGGCAAPRDACLDDLARRLRQP
ncbi:MAG: CCA tRNA nucleotidyltransferase [Pseudomonadota bacterium]